jgi:hypothetical protein
MSVDALQLKEYFVRAGLEANLHAVKVKALGAGRGQKPQMEEGGIGNPAEMGKILKSVLK